MSEIRGRAGSRSGDEVSPDTAPDFGPRWLRHARAGGVALLTTAVHGDFHGVTIEAWIVASFRPFQVLVSLDRESSMVDWIGESGAFALTVLPWREQYLADQFAGFTPRPLPRFAGIPHRLAPGGSPVPDVGIAWVACAVASTFDTGDHACVVGDVLDAGVSAGDADDPLIYFGGRYRRLR